MSDLKKLVNYAKGFSVLYVEDNDALRANASKLLHKFFDTVYTAEDGKVGLEVFKKHHPHIVISDIKMPNMDGISLCKHIKQISPDTKIILMSAFDDKEHLYQAIELGIFRFMKKPVNITTLTEVLLQALIQIKHELHIKLFNMHLRSVFDYQSSMVLMIKDKIPVVANQAFLDFFDIENISIFTNIYEDLGEQLLEHDGFLYNKKNSFWFDEIKQDKQNIYHMKMKDKDDKVKHFIFKYQEIPEKEPYAILSFDDVTELNLLKLFDEKTSKNDENLCDLKSMFNLLRVLQRNSTKIELHNYYKGLSIVNDALITQINNDSIMLKTNFLQEKAVQYERRSFIVCDALPNVIACDEIVSIKFDKQTVEFKNIHFIASSPITRDTIRLVPEEKHTVSLFLGENKFQGEVKIEDISIDAVKLNLNALPAGLVKDSIVRIDMVLHIDKKTFIVNLEATMFKKKENKQDFSVVFIFDGTKKKELVKYVTSRQMAIIREFKRLGDG